MPEKNTEFNPKFQEDQNIWAIFRDNFAYQPKIPSNLICWYNIDNEIKRQPVNTLVKQNINQPNRKLVHELNHNVIYFCRTIDQADSCCELVTCLRINKNIHSNFVERIGTG